MDQYVHSNYLTDFTVEQYFKTHFNRILTIAMEQLLADMDLTVDEVQATAVNNVLEYKESLAIELKRIRASRRRIRNNIIKVQKSDETKNFPKVDLVCISEMVESIRVTDMWAKLDNVLLKKVDFFRRKNYGNGRWDLRKQCLVKCLNIDFGKRPEVIKLQ